jgi:hypothetical protein
VQALASARAQSAAPGIAAPPPPPATSSAPAPPVTQGYLVAAPDQLILLSAKGKTQGIFVLTAAGGPVGHFEITVPPDAADRLKVSPSAGSLPSGGQVQVTVTVNGAAPLDTYLTVDPGNVAIEVESVKA